MLTDPGRVPLGRRAWIGDGRRGASVSPDGTIDWYAHDGLQSRPDLWRLLDEAGPAVRVGPVREGAEARRHPPATRLSYLPGTNVVEAVTDGPSGRRVSVTDFVPWPPTGAGGVVRLVRALSGPVDVEVEVLAGPDRRPGGGTRPVVAHGQGVLLDGLPILAPGPFEAAPLDRDTGRWRSVIHLEPGQEVVVTLGFDDPVGPDAAHRLLDATRTAWRSWSGLIGYSGPYRNSVERALLAIRSLTGLTGAPAGSGTTSLPRRVGSERSSDDRWMCLRDVASAVGVWADCGLSEEAEAAETWLRRTVQDAHLPWPAWFDSDGQPVPDAEALPFTGWRRSEPVVAGRTQPEPDVGLVGSVCSAIGASMRGPGGRAADPGQLSAAWPRLADATDWAADHWRRPDSGVWEIGRPYRLYAAGRVSVWSALDGMARRARQTNPLDLGAAGWQQEGRDLLSWLESEAVADDGGLKMDGAPGAPDEPDAALLSVAWSGPWSLAHPVVPATVDRVVERLSSGPLLYRYSDRVSDERAGPDHPDLEASFQAVRALAALGRWEEAHDRMEAATGLIEGAGAGLLTETADPVSGQLYGNFPHTAGALALVAAALALDAGPR